MRTLPAVTVIGDSHCLSYANLLLDLDGIVCRATPRLIIGCKGWHLAQPQENERKAAFALQLSELIGGARVFCSFGEIDCRLDQGIVRFYKKVGGDIDVLVEQQVKATLAFVSPIARQRELALGFLSVPAPNRAVLETAENPGDVDLLLRIISTYNRSLERAATSAGHSFVDLHAQSVGPDGFAHPAAHIDSHHLRPEVLLSALKNRVSEASS